MNIRCRQQISKVDIASNQTGNYYFHLLSDTSDIVQW